MAYIAPTLRREVIERAGARCEYCLTAQAIVVEMEIDHVIPESAGGSTTADNLCLTCVGCNAFKLAYQTGHDPETGEETALFNPRRDRWEEHFRWSEDGTHLLGLTATGRATIGRLRMNRELIVAARRLWVEAGWHPPAL
ncbi:MAG TPA: HNH endonuclease [Chloroflexota bacterium]|nr:HNH endonuclease [Chloroflexota bacterium]